MFEIARGPVGARLELFRETSMKMRLHEAIIEKDFWVCCVLTTLFSSKVWADKLIFKGGTSLSKVFNAIDRYSEDIDLVIDWRELGYSKMDPWEVSNNSQRSKLIIDARTKLLSYLEKKMVPILKEELSLTLGPGIKVSLEEEVIVIEYPRAFENRAIVPRIILEIGPLASWTPNAQYSISPYSAENFPKAFNMPSGMVRAVTIERTFWEKATILHQEAHRPAEKQLPVRYSRHYYDVFRMTSLGFHETAIHNISLLAQAVRFKEQFYRTPWALLQEAVPGTLRLTPQPQRIDSLEQDYKNMQAMIFNTDPPSFSEIISTLESLEYRINHELG